MELFSDCENLLDVLSGEARAAGVGWVVDEDGAGLVGDLGLEILDVDLPLLLRLESIAIKFHTKVLADGLTQRETRLGHKDAITNLTHDSNGIVKSA